MRFNTITLEIRKKFIVIEAYLNNGTAYQGEEELPSELKTN